MRDEHLPRIVETDGGRSLEYRARDLYHPQHPVERADKRARSIQPVESSLYLLASPLLWHGVSILLSRLPETSHILAIEVDEELRRTALEQLPDDLDRSPRLHFLDEPPVPLRLVETIRAIGVENFRRCKLISLNGGYRLNATDYGHLGDEAEREIESFWKNKITLIHMAPLWIKNLFYNLALYHRDLFHRPKPVARDSIVIGAGPSAESFIPLLSSPEIRSQFRIVSVDTALTPLIKRGIVPDVVVTQEAQFYNLYDFLPLGHRGFSRPQGETETFFWYDMTSHHMIPRLAQKEAEEQREVKHSRGFFLSRFFPTALLDRMAEHGLVPHWITPLGSVGSSAVELALSTSQSRVFTLGLDFSFLYGKSHMRGSPLHLLELHNGGRLRPLGSSPFLFPQHSIIPLRTHGENGFTAAKDLPRRMSTGLLATYARTFKESFASQRGRLYTLGTDGADLGTRRLTVDEFLRMLREGKRSEHEGSEGADSRTGDEEGDSRSKARLFLEQEYELLRRQIGRAHV